MEKFITRHLFLITCVFGAQLFYRGFGHIRDAVESQTLFDVALNVVLILVYSALASWLIAVGSNYKGDGKHVKLN